MTHTTINIKTYNDPSKFPITATVLHKKNKKSYKKKISARYIVGCDGASSRVRKKLNISLKGDSSDSIGWYLGGTVGIGTLLFAFGIGPCVALGLYLVDKIFN